MGTEGRQRVGDRASRYKLRLDINDATMDSPITGHFGHEVIGHSRNPPLTMSVLVI
jgi:hypothetical protein